MPAYTRSDLRQRINAGIKNKIGILINSESTINDAVRQVVSDLDLRSTKRKAKLTPNLFTNIFEYVQPTDMKEMALIDLVPQAFKENQKTDYQLVPPTEFYNRSHEDVIAIQNYDFTRRLLINTKVSDDNLIISTLDDIDSGGGTWVGLPFGGEENIEQDSDDYIKGSGSVKFDLSSTTTTQAGIRNLGLNSQDISDYLGGKSAAFVWFDFNSATNVSSMELRLGSSSTDFYQKQVTTDSNNTAFQDGWNLIRWDLKNLTTVGSPDNTAITFAQVSMIKDSSKVSETDYRADHLVLKTGEISDLYYYSKYGWQSSGGTYKENSTLDTDLLNADTEEFQLFVDKGVEIAGLEVDEFEAAQFAFQKYENRRREYELKYPSERMTMTYDYATF